MRGARSRARFEEHGVHMHLGNSNEHRRGVTVEPLDRARVRPPGLAGRQRTFERGICNLLLVDGSVRTLSMPTNSANFILLLPSPTPKRCYQSTRTHRPRAACPSSPAWTPISSRAAPPAASESRTCATGVVFRAAATGDHFLKPRFCF